MRFSSPFTLLTLLFPSCCLLASQAQNDTRKQENVINQTAPLRPIRAETAPYPEDAFRKGVQGKVTLSIVVDSKGNVSQATALSGPRELIPAALASAKMWQFEPPSSPPVTTTAEVSYGFAKECPGPMSGHGEVMTNGRFTNKRGNVIQMDFDADQPLPPYDEDERRAGVAGNMVLSARINAKGKITKIRVIKSLSPRLDADASKTVRKWKLKLISVSPESLPDNFQLSIRFRPTCDPQF